jgi:hypothetical protein
MSFKLATTSFSHRLDTDMLYMYRVYNSDNNAAVEMYCQQCPQRSLFFRSHQHLRVTGSFPSAQYHAERKGQRIHAKRKAQLIWFGQIHVLVQVEFPPALIFCGVDVTNSRTYPHHIRCIPYRKPASLHSRLEFCHWINAQPQKNHNLFTDKAHFSHDRVNNTKKSCITMISHAEESEVITSIAFP